MLAYHWPAVRTMAWGAVAAFVVVHLGLALVALAFIRGAVRGYFSRSTAQGEIIQQASFYDALVNLLTFGRARVFYEGVLDLARLSPGQRVLDVGCGTGSLALAAKRRVGAEGAVQGVDASPEMVARARHKAARAGLEVTFDAAPAQALPCSDGAFDVVLSTLMIHHLPDDARRQAVAEMQRVLKPGGRLLVVDLTHGHGLWAALSPVSLFHGHDDLYAARDAEALIKEAAFSEVVTGHLKPSVMGYVLGRKEEQHAQA